MFFVRAWRAGEERRKKKERLQLPFFPLGSTYGGLLILSYIVARVYLINGEYGHASLSECARYVMGPTSPQVLFSKQIDPMNNAL